MYRKKKEYQQEVFNIVKVKYFNADTGFFTADCSLHVEPVIGVSILPPHGRIEALCELRQNSSWGPQWFISRVFYESIEDIIHPLLASGFIAHIREAKAENIVTTLGSRFFAILEAACDEQTVTWEDEEKTAVEVLRMVPGIGPVNSLEIVESWRGRRRFFRAAIDAIRVGLTPKQFEWAISSSGYDEFCKMVHNDLPFNIYMLLQHGLSWEDVDKIALTEWEDKPAIEFDSPIRIAGGVRYGLQLLTQQYGHMCAPAHDINATCLDVLGISNATGYVNNLEEYGFTETSTGMVYANEDYGIELNTATHLKRIINNNAPGYDITPEDVNKFSGDITLSDEQVAAVRSALKHKVSIITGGPGVGKTTVLNTIVRILKSKHERVTLCAPTGNAARRMKTATNHEAGTLHRVFSLFRKPKEQDHVEYGWVVIDEMSMTSSRIFSDVLADLGSKVHLVLIGDADQLPPVDRGEPFLQLIEAGIPTVRLTKIYRQDEGSIIIRACHDINSGKMPEPDLPTNLNFIIKSVHRSQLQEECMKAIAWLKKARKAKNEDIQLLTPLNTDRQGFGIGQTELNLEIRKVFNPKWEDNPTPVEGISIRDRVIQRENNYNLGLAGIMNGQIGRVIQLTDDGKTVMMEHGTHVKENGDKETEVKLPSWAESDQVKLFEVEYEDKELAYYNWADTKKLSLAYAMTIHKSQGGQFPHVIMVVPKVQPNFRYRQLIYTGASRPRETLIILEEYGALIQYVSNEAKLRRHSDLSKLVVETCQLTKEVNEPDQEPATD